jgi:hypothetical protein
VDGGLDGAALPADTPDGSRLTDAQARVEG